MRTFLLSLALCVTCLAAPTPNIEVVVPASAALPQNWLRPRIPDNPNPDYRGKSASSLAEFVAPEVISKIAVDQYAGPADDVRRYLTEMPTATAGYFGPSLVLCKARAKTDGVGTAGAGLAWTSTSTVTFASGRIGRLAVATVFPSAAVHFALPPPASASQASDTGCVGTDKVPFDSLYVSYVDPDGYSWYFAVPLQRRK